MNSTSRSLALSLVFALIFSAPARAGDDTDSIKKKLQRKVSFEFVDTPFVDAVEFLRHLSNINVVIDPKVLAERKPQAVNLRVNDMPLDTALQWILKLVELDFMIADNAIFISTPEVIKDRVAPEAKNKKQPAEPQGDGILRARFSTGDQIEIDATMMKKNPDIAREVLSMVFDPAKDEILALVMGKDIPPHIPLDRFVGIAQKIAPQAVLNYDEGLKLLTITSNDESDLHKLNAIARALRKTGGPKEDMKNKMANAEFEKAQAMYAEQAAMLDKARMIAEKNTPGDPATMQKLRDMEMKLIEERKEMEAKMAAMATERKRAEIELQTERKNIELKMQQERQRAELEDVKIQFEDRLKAAELEKIKPDFDRLKDQERALKFRRKMLEKEGAKPQETIPDQF